MLNIILLDSVNSTPSNDNLTIISLIVATLSAIFALRSNYIARKALKLSQREYQDKQSDFSLYLVDNYRLTNSANIKILLFQITITNRSDSSTSLKADLEVEFVSQTNSISKLLIPHNSQLISNIPQKNISPFENTIRIENRGIESKWLLFEQPSNAFTDYRIEKFTIRVTDSKGNIQTVNSYIIKELQNANKQDKDS